MKSKTKEQPISQTANMHRQKDELRKSKAGSKIKEEEASISQDRFRDLVEMTSDWIWEIDSQSVYTYVSPKVTELLGYRADEVLGKTPFDLMPSGEAERIASVIQPLINNAQPISNLQNLNVHREGHLVVLETSGVPILDAAGKVVGYRGIDRDITNRKQMEERLKKSEQRFRSLSEASLEAIVFIEDGIIVDANEALSRLFSYEGEDLRGRFATDFIVPERRALTDERMRNRAEDIYETLGLKKDGGTFPIEVNPREFEIDGRKLRISAVRDLTDRKRIEKQLRDYQEHLENLVEERTVELKKSEEKFRNIFENALEGIYQSTPDARFLSANPALASMFGYDNPEMLVRSVTNIQDQIYANPERRIKLIDILNKEGIARNFEFQIRRKDGSTRYASVNARAVKGENGQILYYEGIIQDITEKKFAIEQMEEQRSLALKLAQIDSLEEGLNIILASAVAASGMECGSILLRSAVTSSFDLVSSVGLTDELLRKVHSIPMDSPTWSRLMQGKSLHTVPNKQLTPIAFEEGFKYISIVPILRKKEVIGCMITASRFVSDIRDQIRLNLEFLAAELGSIIVRMQSREQLDEEISIRRQAERSLEAERQNLEEANTALKVLLKHRGDDKRELEERLVANVKQLVLPYVEKLKKSSLDPFQQMTIDFINVNLKEIISPFLNNIRGFNFTPRQIEVIALIREGRTTKEIAELLTVSKDAVNLQRFLIRKKLGINRDKANLRSYLLSLG
jgi:PAS domain S-box-containing protein